MSLYLDGKSVGVTIKIADPISNKAYAQQMDLLDDILGIKKIIERDYTDKELEKLEMIFINLTGGIDG